MVLGAAVPVLVELEGRPLALEVASSIGLCGSRRCQPPCAPERRGGGCVPYFLTIQSPSAARSAQNARSSAGLRDPGPSSGLQTNAGFSLR